MIASLDSDLVADDFWSTVLPEIDHSDASSASIASPAVESGLDYVDAPSFEKFGEWVETIAVARQGTMWRLARWLAVHRGQASDARQLWRRCQAVNPSWFTSFRIARLRKSSFF